MQIGTRSSRWAATAVLALLGGQLLLPPTTAGAAPEDVTAGLVLRYDLAQTSGTTVTDSSGNGRNGTLVGGGTWTGSDLTLDGTDDYVKLPDNVMTGLDS